MAEWQNITKSFSEDRWVPDSLPDSAQWSMRPQEAGFLIQRTLSLCPFCPVSTLTPLPHLPLCRLLIAGTDSSNLQQILSVLENAKDLLLTSSYLSRPSSNEDHVKFLVTQYLNATDNRWCSWSVSTILAGTGIGLLGGRKGWLGGGGRGRLWG